MKYIGAYVGVEDPLTQLADIPRLASELGATAIGMTTAPTNVWRYPDPTEETCQKFRQACVDYGYDAWQILPHAGFLINLGCPDARKRAMSRQALEAEMRRCSLLGLTMVNFHPGASLGKISDDECLALIADGINRVLEKTEGVKAVIENTAGQGSNLGWNFEQIAQIIARVEDKKRVGVCVDTCHAHAAGIDFTTDDAYREAWAEFDAVIGAAYLCGMHLNDAKRPLGSRIDRHESIGRGTIGAEFFGRLLNDPRTDNIPLLLETPDPALWADEIRTLYGYSVAPE